MVRPYLLATCWNWVLAAAARALASGKVLMPGGAGSGGVGQGRLVGLHGLAEGGVSGGGAALIEGVAADDDDDGDDGDDAVEDGLLAVLLCPVRAGCGEGYKLVLLLQLALGCVIHERSVLQSYKKIAGPTTGASFQFSRCYCQRRQDWARGERF